MINFKNFSTREQESLIKLPAYISLSAANTDGHFDQEEKLRAVEFNHIKTYSCDPAFIEFFQNVDKNFKSTIDQLNKALSLRKVNHDGTIKKKLVELEKIVVKLGLEYASVMHKSMQSFKDHVSTIMYWLILFSLFPSRDQVIE